MPDLVTILFTARQYADVEIRYNVEKNKNHFFL